MKTVCLIPGQCAGCLQSAAVSFPVSVCGNRTAFSAGSEVSVTLKTLLSFLYLCPPLSPLFLFWWLSYLKARLGLIFISNDRFFFSPSTGLFYNGESISFSLGQTWWIWRGMPGPLRGFAGSQPLWPWLSVNVLNRGTSRQPGIRWLAELSLCVFVCHPPPASAPLLRFFIRRLALTSLPFIFIHLTLVAPLLTWHVTPWIGSWRGQN